MTVGELLKKEIFQIINPGDNRDRELKGVYCCDLLSVAMGKAFSGAAWITVMANVNTLAVASLTEVACIVLAEGIMPDEQTTLKAKEQGITLLAVNKPVFEASLLIHELINV